MREPTQPEEAPTIPPRIGIAWCAWHQGYSQTARLVQDAKGDAHFACYSCRRAYDLIPIAD